jgi:hypothetical protein
VELYVLQGPVAMGGSGCAPTEGPIAGDG